MALAVHRASYDAPGEEEEALCAHTHLVLTGIPPGVRSPLDTSLLISTLQGERMGYIVEFDIVSSDLRPLFRIQRVGDARSGRALVLACEPGVRGVDWRPIGEIVVRSTYVPSADCKVAYTAYEIDDLGAHIEPMATVGADLFTQKFRFFQEGAQVAGLQHVPGRDIGAKSAPTNYLFGLEPWPDGRAIWLPVRFRRGNAVRDRVCISAPLIPVIEADAPRYTADQQGVLLAVAYLIHYDRVREEKTA
ncbi:hypothetical protein MOBT1_003034 [Malassezia obtusa]|uniref:Uncharacterized protein n=1 Tax=Malassezia obtusa TaxID=76774 RepID=A0AAF0E3F1_9BASI|nr:hypothetical protein MOBT1_003034 [Malassezia obtusa]